MSNYQEGYTAGRADGNSDRLLGCRPFPYARPGADSDDWHRGYHKGYQEGYHPAARAARPQRRLAQLTAAEKAEIVRRLGAGETQEAVAGEYGISGYTARKVAAEAEVAAPKRLAQLGAAEKAAILRQYETCDFMGAIAADHGITVYTLRRLLTEAGAY